MTFLATRSMALTLPGCTLEVKARLPSLVIANMWDSGCSVGTLPRTLWVAGSITVIEFVISVDT